MAPAAFNRLLIIAHFQKVLPWGESHHPHQQWYGTEGPRVYHGGMCTLHLHGTARPLPLHSRAAPKVILHCIRMFGGGCHCSFLSQVLRPPGLKCWSGFALAHVRSFRGCGGLREVGWKNAVVVYSKLFLPVTGHPWVKCIVNQVATCMGQWVIIEHILVDGKS